MRASDFYDFFPGTALSRDRWPVQYSGPITVADNKVAVTTSGAYTGIESPRVDMNQGSIFASLEIPEYSWTEDEGREFYFELLMDNDNRVSFYWVDSHTLNFRRRIAGTNLVYNTPYDPVAMRYLRFRHAGTSIYYDTSPDGVTWTQRRTMGAPDMDFSSVIVAFLAGDWMGNRATPMYVSHVNTLVNEPRNRFRIWDGAEWIDAPPEIHTADGWETPVPWHWVGHEWKVHY